MLSTTGSLNNLHLNILIAPNSFKGSLNALEAADIIEQAILSVAPDWHTTKLPIADGGDFTSGVLVNALDGNFKSVEVLDPLGRTISSQFGIANNDTAIIEMADASGIKLLETTELNPMKATTYGTGQLIKAALDEGCKEILIGIGGSATVDGGIGMLQALGVRFLNRNGKEVGLGGEALMQIEEIDVSGLDQRIKDTKIVVHCDVENPLLGFNGAAPIFAPQKGANPIHVKLLERGLYNYANKIKKYLKLDVATMKHGGAAGGIAVAIYAFLNGQLRPGSSVILEAINFDEALEQADLVITAEGAIDAQTEGGKAPYEVAKRAQVAQKPVIAFCGNAPLDDVTFFDGVFSIINQPMTLEEAIDNAENLLFTAVQQAIKLMHTLK